MTPAPQSVPSINPSVPVSTDPAAEGVVNALLPPAQPAPGPTAAPVQLDGPGALTDLFIPQNSAGLTLQVLPSSALRLGQKVQFQVRSNAAGNLYVFDFNPNGELFQIFPSFLSAGSVAQVGAGTVHRIPQGLSVNNKVLEITVSEPTGSGHLLALLIQDDPGNVLSTLPANLNEIPVPNASGLLTALAERLNRGVDVNGTTRALNWSSDVVHYTITP